MMMDSYTHQLLTFLLMGQVGILVITWKKMKELEPYLEVTLLKQAYFNFTSHTLSLVVKFIAEF